MLNSIDFLKSLLELARELVVTEKETPPEAVEDRAKAALTELFQQVRNERTPVVVERVVADIDEIVRLVRFPGWQQTAAGEREVKKALRKSLLKYQLHQDVELFERAYGYVRQYYCTCASSVNSKPTHRTEPVQSPTTSSPLMCFLM